MDIMRSIIAQDLDTTVAISSIKKKLDKSFDGKWSVIFGNTFKTYLDPKIFK